MPIFFTIPTPKTPRSLSSSCFALASLIFSPLSTSPANPTTHTALSHFLLNECHLSSPQISKIMKTDKTLLRARSSNTAREAVGLMRDCGFTQAQLHKTILQYPNVLNRRVDRHLKPLFELLTTLGFVGQELAVLVAKQPRLLGCSLEKNLSSRIPFLQKLLGSNQNLVNALKRAPDLLLQNVEKQLKPKVAFFKQRGIEGELLLLLLKLCPTILRASLELLQMRGEYAVNTMGLIKGSRKFIYAICLLVCNGPGTIEKKMQHLRSLGLLEEDVHELVKKDPRTLAFSTKKMQENMEFLTRTAGLHPNVVLSNPVLLGLSVDKRLRPRHAVVRALHAMQKSTPSLPTIFMLSEKKFLQKFVESNPQTSTLREIYKGKVNSTDVETLPSTTFMGT